MRVGFLLGSKINTIWGVPICTAFEWCQGTVAISNACLNYAGREWAKFAIVLLFKNGYKNTQHSCCLKILLFHDLYKISSTYLTCWQTPNAWTRSRFSIFSWNIDTSTQSLAIKIQLKWLCHIFSITFCADIRADKDSRDCYQDILGPSKNQWKKMKKSMMVFLQVRFLRVLVLLKMTHSWPDQCKLFACIIHTNTLFWARGKYMLQVPASHAKLCRHVSSVTAHAAQPKKEEDTPVQWFRGYETSTR